MAEKEIIRGNAKRALQALTDKTKNWKGRIKDFLWEVFIILVAVNITLWFHDWSEKRHERAQAKEFLIDIRESLVQDTISFRNYFNFMDNVLVYYDSVLVQIEKNKIDTQYVDSLSDRLIYNMSMSFNYGIYQSFSSGNNLRLIKNRKLLNDIISLFTGDFPSVDSNIENITKKRIDTYEKYIALKTGYYNNGPTKLSTIIHQPEVIYTFQMGEGAIRGTNDYFKRFIIPRADNLIQEIDQELKTRYNYKMKEKGGN